MARCFVVQYSLKHLQSPPPPLPQAGCPPVARLPEANLEVSDPENQWQRVSFPSAAGEKSLELGGGAGEGGSCCEGEWTVRMAQDSEMRRGSGGGGVTLDCRSMGAKCCERGRA